jgi:glycosyltransferase involved in cell wall biosynthesis
VSLPSVTVCFPAYNEEETIGEVLAEACELLSRSGVEYEILVGNDGSTDATRTIIEEISSRTPGLRIIHHPRNLGIRATFERLYSEATKDFVFLNSTDKQWDTRILFEMLPLAGDWDVIIASRKDKPYGPVRGFVSWAFNMIPRLLFGVRTFDAGAVKLTRREIITRFALVSRSPFSEAERLIRASRAGYLITEHRVEVTARRAGRARGVRPGLVFESIKDVARVWWSLRRDRAAGQANESPCGISDGRRKLKVDTSDEAR